MELSPVKHIVIRGTTVKVYAEINKHISKHVNMSVWNQIDEDGIGQVRRHIVERASWILTFSETRR